jgi:hypothetical protein
MTTRPVHMSVFGFFLAGITDLGYFHIKSECLTCQRVIGIDIDVEAPYLDYGSDNTSGCASVSSARGLKSCPLFKAFFKIKATALIVCIESIFSFSKNAGPDLIQIPQISTTGRPMTN